MPDDNNRLLCGSLLYGTAYQILSKFNPYDDVAAPTLFYEANAMGMESFGTYDADLANLLHNIGCDVFVTFD